MPPARRNIVDRGDSYLFFLTTWKEGRIITGYYELESFIDTKLKARNSKFDWSFPDYALKARRAHFVKNGIKLEKIPGKTFSPIGKTVRSDNSMEGFGPRGCVRLDEVQTLAIKEALDKEPDITSEYVQEIRRLESLNQKQTGFRYPVWRMTESFTEDLIPEYIKNV